jgi:response regulator RpfG family c-di-GMP phosphodiesterase
MLFLQRPRAGGQATVLIVDDDTRVLSALTRELWREPIDIRATTSAREALDIVGRERVDLVIADLRMPEMTGIELLRAVREVSPDTARVLLSAWPDADVARERAGGTIQRLMTKPWRSDEFMDAIHEFAGAA